MKISLTLAALRWPPWASPATRGITGDYLEVRRDVYTGSCVANSDSLSGREAILV
jgi:hypothetical protein